MNKQLFFFDPFKQPLIGRCQSTEKGKIKFCCIYICKYNDSMKFKWDEQKNQINIKKHGLDFADAHKIFDHPMLVQWDDRYEYGEERWVGIGLLNHLVVVVVYVERYKGEIIRIISMRKALKYEQRQFKKSIGY